MSRRRPIVWRRRCAAGATALVVLLVAVAEWNITYAVEISVEGVNAKRFWAKASYVGIVTTPLAILSFAASYSGHAAWLTKKRLAWLSVIPLATLLLALTHEAHHLVWSTVGPSAPAGRPLALEHGPGFYPGWACAYLLMLASAVLLSRVGFRCGATSAVRPSPSPSR